MSGLNQSTIAAGREYSLEMGKAPDGNIRVFIYGAFGLNTSSPSSGR